MFETFHIVNGIYKILQTCTLFESSILLKLQYKLLQKHIHIYTCFRSFKLLMALITAMLQTYTHKHMFEDVYVVIGTYSKLQTHTYILV